MERLRDGQVLLLNKNEKKVDEKTENEVVQAINEENEDEQKKEDDHPEQKVSRQSNRYGEYFNFKYDGKIKFAECKLCEEKNLRTPPIKMLNANTSGVMKHLKNKHNKIFEKIFPSVDATNKSQKLLDNFLQQNKNQILSGSEFRDLLVEWIAVKMLPLNFFDDETTQRFFNKISPHYTFPRRTTMSTHVRTVYNEMRNVVMNVLSKNDSRVSFTVDAWTSIRNKSYYGITGHFIDDQWTIHSLAIDFVPSHGHHTGADIAKIFHDSLNRANLLEKIQGITADNASVNDVFVRELGMILTNENIDFNPEEQHFRCFPHILNLAVKDILKNLEVDIVGDEADVSDCESEDLDNDEDEHFNVDRIPPIQKLRTLCKKIKKSEQLRNRLGHYCKLSDEQLVGFPLDVSTRWNSALQMVTAGLKMKDSLSALARNKQKLKHLYITEEEWNLLSLLQVNLLPFKTLSEKLSGDHYATLHSVVVGINILIDTIEHLCRKLDSKEDCSATDESVILAFQAGRDKILKHYMNTNWSYGAVLILDPRHKVETFDKTTWGKELKKNSYEQFKKILKSKYVEVPEQAQNSIEENENNNEDEYTKSINALYHSEKNVKKDWKQELDMYVRSERAHLDTNILEWWKMNEKNFPRLAKMAKVYWQFVHLAFLLNVFSRKVE